MDKLKEPIIFDGTREGDNPKGRILINLKIVTVQRLRYDEGYAKVRMRYLLCVQAQDNAPKINIVLEEKELRSNRMLSYIFDKYEAVVPEFCSFVNPDIEEEGVTKQVRAKIFKEAKKTHSIMVPFCGGWYLANEMGYGYCRPLNLYLHNLAVQNYLAYCSFLQPPITIQLKQVLVEFRKLCEDLTVRFSCILDPDVRRFFFLFWHYCYMATLFYHCQSNQTCCVEIDDPILRRNVIQFFFGIQQVGSCEMETNTTTRQAFINKFAQTKDLPFIVEERITSGRNTMRAKASDLQKQIADQCANADPSAVPVIFSDKPMDYPGLLHLRLDSGSFSGNIFQASAFDFYSYFCKLSVFFTKAFWDETLSKNVAYYSKQGKQPLYIIFATLSVVLQACYKERDLNLEQLLGVDEDIEAFLDRYLPKISAIPKMQMGEFLTAVLSLKDSKRVQVYHRLEKETAKCVPQQVLEHEACILIGDDGWALNDIAFDKVLDEIPNAPSRRESLRILDRDGALSEARTNRDSLQNKLSVHTFEGETIYWSFVVLRAELFAVPEEEPIEEQLPGHRYFLLGKRAESERQLYWDFDDEKSMNRHMLITGKSGAGKSFLLQKLIRQAAANQMTTIVFHNQGELPDVQDRRVIDVAKDKPSIGFTSEQDFYDAQKIAALLKQALRLRDTQANTIRQCYAEYLKRTGPHSLFDFFGKFKKIATDLELNNYSSVQARLSEILDSKAFSAEPIRWGEYEGKTLILDFCGCSDYTDLFQMQAELLLRDLYYYKKHSPSSPLIVIVDEFQRMKTDDNSALALILREGRKYGWSLWLASQLAASGKSAQLKKLSDQASLQLYFTQGAKGNREIGNMLGTTAGKKNQIFKDLQGLGIGEFLVLQDGKDIRKCIGEPEIDAMSEAE